MLWSGWLPTRAATVAVSASEVACTRETLLREERHGRDQRFVRAAVRKSARRSRYGLEFAQNGKQGVLVGHLFDHRAGLPNMPRGVGANAWDGVVSALAAMAPRWEPGTAHSYHAQTYGYLIGEVLRRITGVSAGTFLRREVCEPLGVDAWIGVPPELDDRCAEVCGQALGFAGEAIRRYESPASNGHTNGRSLARIFGAMACGGEIDGIRLLSKQTLDDAIATWVTGPWIGFDMSLLEPDGPIPRNIFGLRFGRGFMRASEMSWMGPNTGAFGSAGSGGSIGVADPVARVGFGYAQNSHQGPLAGIDSRPGRILQALYACLGTASTRTG